MIAGREFKEAAIRADRRGGRGGIIFNVLLLHEFLHLILRRRPILKHPPVDLLL